MLMFLPPKTFHLELDSIHHLDCTSDSALWYSLPPAADGRTDRRNAGPPEADSSV